MAVLPQQPDPPAGSPTPADTLSPEAAAPAASEFPRPAPGFRRARQRMAGSAHRGPGLAVQETSATPYTGDPHAILGVDAGHSLAEMRLAYRRLAMQSHPQGDAPDPWTFARVNWAWWVITGQHNTDSPAVPDVPATCAGLAVSRRWRPMNFFNESFGFVWKVPGCARSPLTNRNAVFEPRDPNAGFGRHVLDRVKEATYGPGRMRSAWHLYEGLDTWCQRESRALDMPLAEGCQRVVVLRHGMGNHNDLAGAVSHLNRDAELNPVGRAEAELIHQIFDRAGVLEDVGLVVVSPFRRTLQTADLVLGTGHPAPHVVQPLSAEHCYMDASLQRGDMASLTDTLREHFPCCDYPQFGSFEDVDRYCASRNTPGGRWWLHSGDGAPETAASFAERATEFRQWLGAEVHRRRADLTLVVSHGGLLTRAFSTPEFGHCEFRCFDVKIDGSAVRTATGEAAAFPTVPHMPRCHSPPLSLAQANGSTRLLAPFRPYGSQSGRRGLCIRAVRRCPVLHLGHHEYTVDGTMLRPPIYFTGSWRLHELREHLHDVVKVRLGDQAYTEFELPGLFPRQWWVCGHRDGLSKWLYRLTDVMERAEFPRDVADYIWMFLSAHATHDRTLPSPVDSTEPPELRPVYGFRDDLDEGGYSHEASQGTETDLCSDVSSAARSVRRRLYSETASPGGSVGSAVVSQAVCAVTRMLSDRDRSVDRRRRI